MGVRELEEWQRQFQQVGEQAKGLTQGLTEAQFNWRPEPDSWSIEECLAHLTIVGQQEIRLIENAIQEGKARNVKGAGPFRYGWLERTILRQTEPPVRRRFTAPRRFRPLHGQPLTAILPTFLHVQRQFAQLAADAEGLDLARVKVATPISRLLKLSLGITLAQAAAHERRHLEQAHRVRQNPRFPAK
ncbi:MAG TPA: DinB family protein [Bryobacteraceae bacterium]|nr:DinB family protein [Bryobacteraceae bacterium]